MSGSTPSPSPEYLAEDIGPTLVATASIMMAFITVFVALRYYARYLLRTSWGIEDFIIPLAWLAEMGLCITGMVMVHCASTGRHIEAVIQMDPHKITEHFKGITVVQILHPTAVAFPKIVVVILFIRIFDHTWEKKAAWATAILIAATWFSYTVAALFACTPFKFNWDKSDPSGKCFDVLAFSMSSSIPNIITDIIMLLLPMRTVFHLKVSMARRVGLLLIFLTGSVGIVASIIRTVVFSSTDQANDITYNHVALLNWTILEPGMYLLAACAISFRPLWRMIAHTLHLDAIITNTRSLSLAGMKIPKHGTPSTVQPDIHLTTFNTGSSGGFTKLDSGRDKRDEEAEIGMNATNARGLNITVTHTVETQYEEAHDLD